MSRLSIHLPHRALSGSGSYRRPRWGRDTGHPSHVEHDLSAEMSLALSVGLNIQKHLTSSPSPSLLGNRALSQSSIFNVLIAIHCRWCSRDVVVLFSLNPARSSLPRADRQERHHAAVPVRRRLLRRSISSCFGLNTNIISGLEIPHCLMASAT